MASSQKGVSPKSKRIVIAVSCAVVILIVVGILGFRDGGWFRKVNTTYEAQYVQSLTDYAKQLEKAGNSEAAAVVYELIAKRGSGDLIRNVNEEFPLLKAVNEIEQFKEFVSGSKKGNDR